MFVGSVKTKRGADLIFEIIGERASLAQKYWWKVVSKPSSRETGDEMAATKVPGDAEAAVESDSEDESDNSGQSSSHSSFESVCAN